MKRYVWIPVSIAALVFIFLCISFMVSVSRKKNKWIKRKLRIGALLLSLTATQASSLKGLICNGNAKIYKYRLDNKKNEFVNKGQLLFEKPFN